MIKELRERTSVGMGKCKQALEKADGDVEKAIELLRKEGLSSAAKKEGRETKEGMICFAENDEAIAIVDIRAETDFVTQNDLFKDFAKQMADEALKTCPKDAAAFLEQKSQAEPEHTINEVRAHMVQRIGENIQIERVKVIKKDKGHSYGVYSHMGGQILCMAEISGSDKVSDLARNIAMHIAAEAPEYLDHSEVPEEIVKKEEEIAKSQVPGNKPPEIAKNIVTGKVRAALDQISLLKQKYVKDPSTTVEKFVAAEGKTMGSDLKVVSFMRW